MDTIFGGEADSGDSTDDGEDDHTLEVEGRLEERECKWANLTRRILLKCFMASKDRWPVLIMFHRRRSGWECWEWKNAIEFLDIDPTTHPHALVHRSDVKICLKVLEGEFLHRVHAGTKYFKFIPNED